jgi:hypothetical protein
MFSNIAKFRAESTVRAAPRPVAPVHSNDNAKAVHAAGELRSRGRQILSCHWRPAASGGLECCWEVERATEASAEEPDERCIAVCEPSGVRYAA